MVEPDEELVQRSRRGDVQAFSCLVERYEQPAMVVARSILRSWHDARDAVQDAFVVAFTQLKRLWSPHKFGAWFMRIVRRQALLHLRRRTRRSRQLVPLPAELVNEPAINQTSCGEAALLIARLPEQECVVVSLRHIKELSVGEIAGITGRPIGTVTKQLSRAYARMRQWLDGAR
ncbi:MAG TPA: RNA polymerase sigma factor [Humisphaera sp.]|nr:RNA polymerase sigma factor [Humisphaera sp.]